jgi:hypothetical protein
VVNIILLLAIVSACACLVFFTASGMVADGPNWASEVCSTAPSLCRIASRGCRRVLDEIAFALRYAARLVTADMAQGFSSDAAPNDLRSDAATALNAVAGSLDAGTLTRDVTNNARRAVAGLLAGFS